MDYCSDMGNEKHLRHILKKVNVKKHFYLRNFIIGFLLSMLFCIIGMLFRDSIMELAENMYELSAYDCKRIFVSMMWIWKLFFIQFALVPFISLSMIEGRLKKEE